ncbi:YybH family protein [Mariluticola halotolerans]|uniref:YybH family protein n=1 Tax=Mariluticola halotolerans TaxID=2909283 RepID=UPI0034A0B0FC
MPEPLQSRGLQAYSQTWDLFYSYGDPHPELFVIEDLTIIAGEDVGFAFGLLRIGGSVNPVCRLTLGLQKHVDQWLIRHEHHSSPLTSGQ